MTRVIAISVIFVVAIFSPTSAFWSLETDLQFGYEVYDRAHEISAAIQAILAATQRDNMVITDDVTRAGLNALSAISVQLRTAPPAFFNELAFAAASRGNNEQWHLTRLRKSHATYMSVIDTLTNATGPLSQVEDITNPLIVVALRQSLHHIVENSRDVMNAVEKISVRVSQVRANSSLLLTPKLVAEFIEEADGGAELTTFLAELRNSYMLLLLAVRDTARLTAAHGSMYEIMEKSTTRDKNARNTSLFNFVSSYGRVRSTLITSVVANRQTAQSGFASFVQRVQTSFDDSIVRPRFDREQLPLIAAFVDVIVNRVYNQTFFETSFDGMHDAIVEAFTSDTDEVFSQDSQYRNVILGLLRRSFVRRYANCLNELVSVAQSGLRAVTAKYAFCLDERTSSITVVIPSTSSWLSVIRDNVNFIVEQLNACLNGPNTVTGRTTISACIQSNVNNLQFYAMYLPLTVETNLRPIVQSPPMIFKNCVNVIKYVVDENVERFGDAYRKCSNETESVVTTTQAPSTTTGEWLWTSEGGNATESTPTIAGELTTINETTVDGNGEMTTDFWSETEQTTLEEESEYWEQQEGSAAY